MKLITLKGSLPKRDHMYIHIHIYVQYRLQIYVHVTCIYIQINIYIYMYTMYIYVYIYISSSLIQLCWSGGIYWKWCNLTGQYGGHTTWGHEEVKFYPHVFMGLLYLPTCNGSLWSIRKHTIPMVSTGYDMSPTAID